MIVSEAFNEEALDTLAHLEGLIAAVVTDGKGSDEELHRLCETMARRCAEHSKRVCGNRDPRTAELHLADLRLILAGCLKVYLEILE